MVLYSKPQESGKAESPSEDDGGFNVEIRFMLKFYTFQHFGPNEGHNTEVGIITG